MSLIQIINEEKSKGRVRLEKLWARRDPDGIEPGNPFREAIDPHTAHATHQYHTDHETALGENAVLDCAKKAEEQIDHVLSNPQHYMEEPNLFFRFEDKLQFTFSINPGLDGKSIILSAGTKDFNLGELPVKALNPLRQAIAGIYNGSGWGVTSSGHGTGFSLTLVHKIEAQAQQIGEETLWSDEETGFMSKVRQWLETRLANYLLGIRQVHLPGKAGWEIFPKGKGFNPDSVAQIRDMCLRHNMTMVKNPKGNSLLVLNPKASKQLMKNYPE